MNKYYWIRERITNQTRYYIACGQITVKEAKAMDGVMTRYKTEQEYIDKITELQQQGFSVHVR